MLIAVSDLHFSDGTAGEHNLPPEAFEDVFLGDLQYLIKDKKPKEIKLLLLGDIIDLLRSEQWLADNFPLDDRPWGKNGLADVSHPRLASPTEQRCLQILGQVPPGSLTEKDAPATLARDTVLAKNWQTLKLIRELPQIFQEQIPVEILYIPGNHDRLVNLYPSLRDAVQAILGVTVNARTVDYLFPGQWWYSYHLFFPDYGVLARHGHEYDLWNYGGGRNFTREGQLQVPIGDVFTTEFSVKVPWLVSFEEPELAERLKDMDNVRPLSRVLEWLYYKMRKQDYGKYREIINKTLERVFSDLLEMQMVQQWRSPQTAWDELLRLASTSWLRWLPQTIVQRLGAEDLLSLFLTMSGETERPERDVYVTAAFKEPRRYDGQEVRFVIYGHTHTPLQLPLDGEADREVLYLNTGTWRNRIHRTVALDEAPDFMELKHLTYTVFYRGDEDLDGKQENTLSFETWSGIKKKYYTRGK